MNVLDWFHNTKVTCQESTRRVAQVGIWECLAELARTSVREPTGVWAGSGVHASPSGQGLDYVEC